MCVGALGSEFYYHLNCTRLPFSVSMSIVFELVRNIIFVRGILYNLIFDEVPDITKLVW